MKTKQNKYKKLTSKLTMVKLMKNKNNEQIIKAAREKRPFFKGQQIKYTSTKLCLSYESSLVQHLKINQCILPHKD